MTKRMKIVTVAAVVLLGGGEAVVCRYADVKALITPVFYGDSQSR